MVLGKEKFESAVKTYSKLKKCVYSSCPIILFRFIIPMMVLILVFLGAVQAKYPHESSFQEDLNTSMGTLGGAFYRIYGVGLENPNWVYYFLFILGGMAFFTGEEVYQNVKRVWLGLDEEMSAQEVIDASGEGMGNYINERGSKKYIK